MIDVFIVQVLCAGCLVAVLSGPLGSFLVWRRMAFFGETLTHSTLLGISLSLMMNLDPLFGLFFTCLMVAAFISYLSINTTLAIDTVMAIISHSLLALGLVLMTYLARLGYRFDILGLLYGDILTVTTTDIIVIVTVNILTFSALFFLWKPLILVTINEELAQTDGVQVPVIKSLYIVLLSLVISILMKIVGILMIVAMLIIPPSAARMLSSSPENMVIKSSLIGILSVLVGVSLSLYFDVATGPSIVVVSTIIFLVTLLMGKKN